jgi:hypothetical protein
MSVIGCSSLVLSVPVVSSPPRHALDIVIKFSDVVVKSDADNFALLTVSKDVAPKAC